MDHKAMLMVVEHHAREYEKQTRYALQHVAALSFLDETVVAREWDMLRWQALLRFAEHRIDEELPALDTRSIPTRTQIRRVCTLVGELYG